ncbi:MAG: hypothetical protein ACI9TY_000795 [Alphaproteobacteria bacterium]|jgi:hypothetical protein
MQKIAIGLCMLMSGVFLAHTACARPVLLELYTSEGCSSCPAGEETVADLNKRDDFFALSFHVDYWDGLGWKDKWAKKEFTNRQKAYMKKVGSNKIYTPQAVLDGVEETVASWGWRVKMLAYSVRQKQVDIPMRLENDLLYIEAYNLQKPVDIWYVTYNDTGESNVQAGENRGRVMKSVNVVRSLEKLSVWHGEKTTIRLPSITNGGQHTAVIVQDAKFGKVLGLLYK